MSGTGRSRLLLAIRITPIPTREWTHSQFDNLSTKMHTTTLNAFARLRMPKCSRTQCHLWFYATIVSPYFSILLCRLDVDGRKLWGKLTGRLAAIVPSKCPCLQWPFCLNIALVVGWELNHVSTPPTFLCWLPPKARLLSSSNRGLHNLATTLELT